MTTITKDDIRRWLQHPAAPTAAQVRALLPQHRYYRASANEIDDYDLMGLAWAITRRYPAVEYDALYTLIYHVITSQPAVAAA